MWMCVIELISIEFNLLFFCSLQNASTQWHCVLWGNLFWGDALIRVRKSPVKCWLEQIKWNTFMHNILGLCGKMKHSWNMVMMLTYFTTKRDPIIAPLSSENVRKISLWFGLILLGWEWVRDNKFDAIFPVVSFLIFLVTSDHADWALTSAELIAYYISCDASNSTSWLKRCSISTPSYWHPGS